MYKHQGSYRNYMQNNCYSPNENRKLKPTYHNQNKPRQKNKINNFGSIRKSGEGGGDLTLIG